MLNHTVLASNYDVVRNCWKGDGACERGPVYSRLIYSSSNVFAGKAGSTELQLTSRVEWWTIGVRGIGIVDSTARRNNRTHNAGVSSGLCEVLREGSQSRVALPAAPSYRVQSACAQVCFHAY